MVPLKDVRPNGWNPNTMTPQQFESLKHGLKSDGWLASQALLVWGMDDKGQRRDLIIDGEHRWKAALELGFVGGPMVFLDGISEAKAKALTVKMDQKRGQFDTTALSELVRSIEKEAASWADNLALDLGIPEVDLEKLLAVDPVNLNGPANPPPRPKAPDQGPALPSGLPPTAIKLVQVHLNGEQHGRFEAALRVLAERLGTNNASDTIYQAIVEAAGPVAAKVA